VVAATVEETAVATVVAMAVATVVASVVARTMTSLVIPAALAKDWSATTPVPAPAIMA